MKLSRTILLSGFYLKLFQSVFLIRNFSKYKWPNPDWWYSLFAPNSCKSSLKRPISSSIIYKSNLHYSSAYVSNQTMRTAVFTGLRVVGITRVRVIILLSYVIRMMYFNYLNSLGSGQQLCATASIWSTLLRSCFRLKVALFMYEMRSIIYDNINHYLYDWCILMNKGHRYTTQTYP